MTARCRNLSAVASDALHCPGVVIDEHGRQTSCAYALTAHPIESLLTSLPLAKLAESVKNGLRAVTDPSPSKDIKYGIVLAVQSRLEEVCQESPEQKYAGRGKGNGETDAMRHAVQLLRLLCGTDDMSVAVLLKDRFTMLIKAHEEQHCNLYENQG